MLLRKPPPPLLRNLPRRCISPESSSAAAGAGAITFSHDPWIAKVVVTAFLLSPAPPAAAARLAAFREALLTPSVAVLVVQRLGNPNSAAELFAAGLPGDMYAAVRMLCRSRLSAAALALFDRILSERRPVDGELLGHLITSFSAAGDLDAGLALLRRAPELNCRLPAFAFNSLMNLLAARNRAGEAVSLFRRQLASPSFSPDTCSFNIAVRCLLRTGDLDGAIELFHAMGSFGCSPDDFSHNILIHGLCRANQVEKGRQILRDIRSTRSRPPGVITYTSVISGLCKMGNMADACEVFDEMLAMGITPTEVTFNVLIDGFGKAGDTASAAAVHGKMAAAGCSPDVVTFTSLIDGHCRAGQLQEALRLWREMGSKKGILPNAYTFSVLVNALCRMNRLSEARELLAELRRRADIAVPGAFVYNPAIDGFCKAGNLEEASRLVMEMEEKGCTPDKVTYTILIIGHCMKGRAADAIALFAKMNAVGCEPDAITVGSLVSCLLKAGMAGEADRIMLSSSSFSVREADDVTGVT